MQWEIYCGGAYSATAAFLGADGSYNSNTSETIGQAEAIHVTDTPSPPSDDLHGADIGEIVEASPTPSPAPTDSVPSCSSPRSSCSQPSSDSEDTCENASVLGQFWIGKLRPMSLPTPSKPGKATRVRAGLFMPPNTFASSNFLSSEGSIGRRSCECAIRR